ncbi:MAG: hypothetical protein L6R39_000833 [Caloplaca ligustica]|nr:MAG: hypothetical protein L6R39_000833 [Caloplaca ligustica]
MPRSPRFFFLVILLVGGCALLLTRAANPLQSIRHAADGTPPTTSSATPLKGKAPLGSSADVRNSTLGFERVFVINLPERHDKLDAFSLVASLTGFTFDIIEGIKGLTVVNKTLPSLEKLPKVDMGTRESLIGPDLDHRRKERGTILSAAGVRT